MLKVSKWVSDSHLMVSDSLGPHGLWHSRILCLWNSPGKNTGVGCHCLLRLSPHTPTKTQSSSQNNKKKNKQNKGLVGASRSQGAGFWTVSAQSSSLDDDLYWVSVPWARITSGGGTQQPWAVECCPLLVTPEQCAILRPEHGRNSVLDRLRGCDRKLMFVVGSLFCCHN